jgi:hypothetical protein
VPESDRQVPDDSNLRKLAHLIVSAPSFIAVHAPGMISPYIHFNNRGNCLKRLVEKEDFLSFGDNQTGHFS